MQDEKKVSVIIPVYNSEKYLEECINSIVNQTYKNLEIILINDASSDNSLNICTSYQGKDSRVKVISHEENQGLSISRYDGINISTGEWICFVDNDDYMPPWAIEELIKNSSDSEMAKFGGIDVSDTLMNNQISEIDYLKKYKVEKISGYELNKISICGTSTCGIISCLWGGIYKRNLIDRALEITVRQKEKLPWLFCEDIVAIPIVYSLAKQVTYIKTIGYLHRCSADSLSIKKEIKPYHIETADAGDFVLGYLKEINCHDLFNAYIENYLSNLESIYYKVCNSEYNGSKKNIIDNIERKFDKYYDFFKKNHRFNAYALTIILFYRNRWLWNILVGKLYFYKKYG